MELKQLLNHWTPARLTLFLKVRHIPVPNGISKQDLVDFVISKKDVPIIDVKASKELLSSLIQEQLVDYLQLRGYVVLNKGRVCPTIPRAYIQTQETELLRSAIEDFEKNYPVIPDDLDAALRTVLIKDYSLDVSDQLILRKSSGRYTDLTLDNVLKRFGEEWTFARTVDAKWLITHECVSFFSRGDY